MCLMIHGGLGDVVDKVVHIMPTLDLHIAILSSVDEEKYIIIEEYRRKRGHES